MVITTLALCLLGALLLPLAANAEKGLIAQQSIGIKASPKAVWAIVKDFDRLNSWHPAFKDDVIIWQGTFNNKPGSGKTDTEVVELLNGAYKAGLDNVKNLAEQS